MIFLHWIESGALRSISNLAIPSKRAVPPGILSNACDGHRARLVTGLVQTALKPAALYHLSMGATRPEFAGSDSFYRVPAHVLLRRQEEDEDEDEEEKKDDDKEDDDEDDTTDDGYSE